MTYQTNNPVGSVDVRDLYDNAEAFDNFSAGPLDAYPDRFGVSRQSLQGIRNASQYVDLGPYAAGMVFTSRNQVFSYLGEFYAPGPAIVLPYTTTGAGAGEIANFRSVGDAVLRSDLAASTGAGRVGWKRSPLVSVINTVSEMLDSQTRSLWEYENLVASKPNPSNPATWDWSPAIQAWVNDAGVNGDTLYAPPGLFQHSAKITLPHFVSIIGRGISYNTAAGNGTIFHYTGTDDGWEVVSPINSVSPTHVKISDIVFYAPNVGIGKGAFADNSSLHFDVIRCAFLHNSQGAGLILDQSEIARVELCYFEALGHGGTGANLWIVNGDDRRPGAGKQFSNQLVITRNDFNAVNTTTRGVLDDGGIAHAYRDNNFNGGSIQLVCKEVNGLTIDGGEMEAAAVANIRIYRPGGANATPTVSIKNVFLLVLTGAIGVDYAQLTTDSLEYTNNIFSGPVSDNVGTLGPLTVVKAFGNQTISAGSLPFNNYNTRGTIVPTVRGSATPGAHTYSVQSSKWRRNGDQTTVSVNILFATKDAAMAGSVEIDCLPIPVTGDFQAGGIAAYNGVTLPAGHTQLGISAVPGTTLVRLYTMGSAAFGAALGSAGISGAFSITFAVTYF